MNCHFNKKLTYLSITQYINITQIYKKGKQLEVFFVDIIQVFKQNLVFENLDLLLWPYLLTC